MPPFPPTFVAPAATPLRTRLAPPPHRLAPRRRFACAAASGPDSDAAPSPQPHADWRAFRARLVRSEAAASATSAPPPPSPSPDRASARDESAPDTHEWAHHVPFVERGMLLLASPKHFTGDRRASFFAATAVLLLEAGERGGALGIVLNRPVVGNTLGHTRLQARRRRTSASPGSDAGAGARAESGDDVLGELAGLSGSAVRLGGPVGLEALFVVHGDAALGQRVSDGVQVGPFDAAVQRLRDGMLDNARFFCGYAGWHAGQLEREVRDGVWVPCACSASVVLRDWPAGRAGIDHVLRLMGGEYAALADLSAAGRDGCDDGGHADGDKASGSSGTDGETEGGAAQ